MHKHYIVKVTGKQDRYASTIRHNTLEEAEIEAQRLVAKENLPVTVYEAVSRFELASPPVIKVEFEQGTSTRADLDE